MFTLRSPWLAALMVCCAACHYDLDRIYEHEILDGGGGQESAVTRRSPDLIGLWGNYPTVDEECIRCAESSCAQAEDSCRGDPECEEFTRCVAQTPTPAGQMACRTRHLVWVTSGDVLQRDLNGPYGQCVFRDTCMSECGGAEDLACLHAYSWPTTSEQSVPLYLVLNDSQDIQRRLAGVDVKVCPEGDALCKTPRATGTTDERGYIALDLPTSFSRAFTGFLQLEGADIYPTLLKLSWNPGSATMLLVTLVNKATFDFYVTNFLKVELDESRGMLQTRMFGCSGITTRGVRFASTGVDEKTQTWYLEDGIPSLLATETNMLGSGGTFNLLPDYQTVTATRVSDAEVVARANAPVRAGFMTIVVFAPLSQ